jgi:mannitol-1-phosphate 5-dehydrogenase
MELKMRKKFVQYGAGNIGRGFLGQLFSKAGYDIEFIDVNMEIIDALNRDKRYPVNIVSKTNPQEIWIENASGINGMNTPAVADSIATADIMATAVGVNILPRIVDPLVAGLRRRLEIGNKNPLNIIICENLIDADKLLHKLINEKLSDEEKPIINEMLGLVEASIGRMVPVMTEKQRQGNVLRVCVESYCELPIDKAAFKGEIPKVPHLYPYTPFELYIKRKLFVHNMGHALTAYLSNLIHYEYIYEAIENPYIKIIVQRAMNESALALSKQFDISLCDVLEHISDLLIRFSNQSLGDTVLRVGRDTQRKLCATDRFAGAIKLCESCGISPVYISLGIAAGLFFDCPDDSGTSAVKLKLQENGIDVVLKDLCGISKENISYGYIKTYFELFKNGAEISSVLSKAEQIQEEILKTKNVI